MIYTKTSYTSCFSILSCRCPVDETTEILPSGKDFARFKFSSFQFIGEAPEVYLDCDVMVCEPHDPAPNCQNRWCNSWEGNATAGPMAKRSRASSQYKSRYFHLTAGPLLIPAKHSVHNTNGSHQTGRLATSIWNVIFTCDLYTIYSCFLYFISIEYTIYSMSIGLY